MVNADVERILFTEEQIRERVRELAREIRAVFDPDGVYAVGVLTGAFVFLSDLIRQLDLPVEVGFVTATSYRDGTRPGALLTSAVGELRVAGRDVLLVEDILDTGRSLEAVQARLREAGARSLRTAVLLDKAERREVDVPVDFRGFEVPNEFLVGYGLDYAGRYRGLPYVGVLRRSVYEGV